MNTLCTDLGKKFRELLEETAAVQVAIVVDIQLSDEARNTQ